MALPGMFTIEGFFEKNKLHTNSFPLLVIFQCECPVYVQKNLFFCSYKIMIFYRLKYRLIVITAKAREY